MSPGAVNVHATAVAVGEWAVMLRGGSGAGKSDLGLRLIEAGGILIADDRVDLTIADGRLWAAPPPVLAGLIEVRGVGLCRMPWRAPMPILMLIDLVATELVERLPEPEQETVMGVTLTRLRLDPWPVSAALKVRLAVTRAARDNVTAITPV